jgi:hypothetical protein
VTMVLSVRRRIVGIARAEPDRTALVGFGTDLAEQVLSWREFAGQVADAAGALGAALDRRTPPAERDALLATGASTGIPKISARPGPLRYDPVPPGMTGTVFMRTPQRVGRSDYVNDQAIRTTLDGFAAIGDHGRLDRDGYLYLEPRDHDTINVGGQKVDPDEVEAVLRDHPAVHRRGRRRRAAPHARVGGSTC